MDTHRIIILLLFLLLSLRKEQDYQNVISLFF